MAPPTPTGAPSRGCARAARGPLDARRPFAPAGVRFLHPPAVAKLTAHRRRSSLLGSGLGFEHLFFVALYALAAQLCLSTVGQPHAAAVAHAAARKAALQAVVAGINGSAVHALAAASSNASSFLLPPPPPPPPELADDFDPWAEELAAAAVGGEVGAPAPAPAPGAAAAAAKAPPPAAAGFSDTVAFGGGAASWVEDSEADGDAPLPSPLLPAFWALVLTAAVGVLHALSQLAQHWSMGVKVAVRYAPARRVAPGVVLCAVPPPHQGRPTLCPVEKFTRGSGAGSDGGEGMFFIYQRQRYELEAVADDAGLWRVCPLPYPVSSPIGSYLSAPGLAASEGTDAPGTLRTRFGRNDFEVPVPTLRVLYTEQLLGPVTQFQLFSALLWVMDEYWKYALFHTGMIFMFEGTTAFGRLKSLQTLRGMGHKPRLVRFRRANKPWRTRASLVPSSSPVSADARHCRCTRCAPRCGRWCRPTSCCPGTSSACPRAGPTATSRSSPPTCSSYRARRWPTRRR